VNDAQVFYQHTDVTQGANFQEQFLNGRGEVPIRGVNEYYDITSLTHGHQQVPTWYLQNVIPTLNTVTAPVPGVTAATTPDTPPPADPTGPSYAIGVFSTVTNSIAVATNLENLIQAADTAYTEGRGLLFHAEMLAFIAYVQLENGTGLQSSTAKLLTGVAAGMEAIL
jgi:hypothetical protein